MMKNNNKNVCVITWYNSLNYGTCIQCYALTQFISKNGYHVFVPESFKYYYGLKHPIETIGKIKSITSKKNKNVQKDTVELPREIQKGYEVRKNKNTEFAYSMNTVVHFNSRREFNEFINKINIFVTGSDQIWNPDYVTPPHLLSCAKSIHKKIAYGSSIGVKSIPNKKKKLYKKYLSRFDDIGVREYTAKVELENLLSKKVYNVLDPVFLLNRSDWEKIAIQDKNRTPEEKFIFCYFIGNNLRWVDEIKKYSETNKLNVYCALSEFGILPDIGTLIPEIGVGEFIWYILNAEFVVTDSFHATALSINFEKNFVVYNRFSDTEKKSQNSRIADLLNQFKLKKRLISNENIDQTEKILDEKISYEEVFDILTNKKNESISFLKNAIEQK